MSRRRDKRGNGLFGIIVSVLAGAALITLVEGTVILWVPMLAALAMGLAVAKRL